MRLGMVLACLACFACGDDGPRTRDCNDGETRPCYAGPPGTEGVGRCAPGTETCAGGAWPGVCLGDRTPFVERCNGLDEDCDGVIDNVVEDGEPCSSGGCGGVRQCVGTEVRCVAPAKNECDLCGGPSVSGLGTECTANSCFGALVCSADMRSAECNAPVQNECGVCGGPAVTGLGVGCMSIDGCTGTTACNADGSAAVCNAPTRNECLLCGGPPVAGVGGTCTGDRGCVGVGACNAAGDGLDCALDSPCAHVVIAELTTDSAVCNTDEFVELYNPSTRTVSLAGYTLRYRPATGTSFTRLVAFASTASIAPRGFFLIASARSSTGCSNAPAPGGGYPAVPGNTVTADATYTALDLSATGGQLWLVRVDADPTGVTDPNVVDMVGYGSANTFEGSAPASAPVDTGRPSGSSERKANAGSTATSLASGGADETAGNGHDTDDNAADFVAQAARVPQNTASTAEP